MPNNPASLYDEFEQGAVHLIHGVELGTEIDAKRATDLGRRPTESV